MAKKKKVSAEIAELKALVDQFITNPVGDSQSNSVARIKEIFEKLGA